MSRWSSRTGKCPTSVYQVRTKCYVFTRGCARCSVPVPLALAHTSAGSTGDVTTLPALVAASSPAVDTALDAERDSTGCGATPTPLPVDLASDGVGASGGWPPVVEMAGAADADTPSKAKDLLGCSGVRGTWAACRHGSQMRDTQASARGAQWGVCRQCAWDTPEHGKPAGTQTTAAAGQQAWSGSSDNKGAGAVARGG